MFTLYTDYTLLCTGKAVHTFFFFFFILRRILFHYYSWLICVQQYPHETHEMTVDFIQRLPSLLLCSRPVSSAQADHRNHVQTHCIIGGTSIFFVRRAV